MSDTDLRELERRFRETGALDDEVAWRAERVRFGLGSGLRPIIRIDEGVAHFKIAYVSPCDSKKCPATRALVLLHEALRPCSPGDLTSIAVEGDRTLFFEVDLPKFDLGELKARVQVFCASGAVWARETRRLVTKGAAGVVFVPSLVEGRLSDTYESVEHLLEDLERQARQPEELPFVLQWLPGDSRPEVPPESVRDSLDLPFLASFSTDRNSGEGIERAFMTVVEQARVGYLEAGAGA